MNLTDCERTLQFNCSESQAVSVICRDGKMHNRVKRVKCLMAS